MRASGSLALCLLLAAAACEPRVTAPVTPDESARRNLHGGEVIGFVGSYGSHVWMGIPFARPPVSELRWRAPGPPEPWAGTLEALSPPPVCPQFPSPLGVESESSAPLGTEDCLYLNVYAPRFSRESIPGPGRRLPVMVWIHGGGNVIGQASSYDGGNLAATHDVLVVTVQYRLGPLGWFRHEALRASAATDEDRSGNFGTLDLIRALEWVRDDAAAFGGDPQNVTIFGESAGGRNVVSLLLSPKARGLFHRAIVQSGGTTTMPPARAESFADAQPAGEPNSSNEILLRLLRRAGRADTRKEARAALGGMTPADVERFLRDQSPERLLRVYRTEDQEALIEVPQLFRDGAVLPEDDPLEQLREPGHVPVILGTNRDENKLFMALNPEYVRRLFWLFPLIRDPQRYEATAAHLAMLWKATGADLPASSLARGGGAPVWVYRFDWDEEPDLLFVEVSKLLGAAHAFEIPFVFGHWDLGSPTDLLFDERNRAPRERLSGAMMAYWAAFARTGDPNGVRRDLPRWEPFDPERARFLVFDTEAGGGIRMEHGQVTIESVLAAVDHDSRLPNRRAKCDVYRRIVEWTRSIPREDYPGLGSGGCHEYPLDEPVFD